VLGGGFLLAAVPSVIVASGIILIYFGHGKEQLTSDEARFRKICDRCPVMMHSIDKRGVIRKVNTTWLDETR
jgi:hypothetical protein